MAASTKSLTPAQRERLRKKAERSLAEAEAALGALHQDDRDKITRTVAETNRWRGVVFALSGVEKAQQALGGLAA